MYQKAGKLKVERTDGGHRRYRVADVLKVDNTKLRFTVTYGRVSTPDKKADLARQVALLDLYCQEHGYTNVYALQDIGSGLNYKNRLLDQSYIFDQV